MGTDTGTLKVTGIPAQSVNGEGPHDLTTAEDSRIEIRCKVTGLPLPKHIWYYRKWGEVSGVEGSTKRVKLDERKTMDMESGSLIIENAQIEDSGKYICNAANDYGEPVVESAIIQVRKKSVRLSPEYQSASIKAGEDVLFHCDV